MSNNIPENLRYSKDHEWIKVEGDIATVGITDYAQHALGDVVYVDMPRVGDKLGAHEAFGSVESVKAVSEIFTPSATRTRCRARCPTLPARDSPSPKTLAKGES